MTDKQTDRGGFFTNLFWHAACRTETSYRYLHLQMPKLNFDLHSLWPERGVLYPDFLLLIRHGAAATTGHCSVFPPTKTTQSRWELIFIPHRKSLTADLQCDVRVLRAQLVCMCAIATVHFHVTAVTLQSCWWLDALNSLLLSAASSCVN